METVIDKSKTEPRVVEKRARIIIASIFMICFIISLVYWLYNVYEIYNTDITSFEKAGEVWHYIGRKFVAFEAVIISFFLFYASLKI